MTPELQREVERHFGYPLEMLEHMADEHNELVTYGLLISHLQGPAMAAEARWWVGTHPHEAARRLVAETFSDAMIERFARK